jgi:hypothetical protein
MHALTHTHAMHTHCLLRVEERKEEEEEEEKLACRQH